MLSKVQKSVLVFALAVFVLHSGCSVTGGRTVSEEEVIEILGENVGKPYGCLIQSRRRVRNPEVDGVFQLDSSCEHLFLNDGVSCEIFTMSSPEIGALRAFRKRGEGIVHLVQQSLPWVSPAWSCDTFALRKETPPSLALFPIGGWGLLSQAQSLVMTLGMEVQVVSGRSLHLAWSQIPDDTIEAILNQFGLDAYQKEDFVELQFRMSLDSGCPTFIGVYLGGGEYVETTFEEFVFFEEDYSSKAVALENKFLFPPSFECECDAEQAGVNSSQH